ncbi:Aerobic respiration control protein ArcA [Thauera sp. GDN1]|uniref:response regulator n=1 Tax=Thauera sp. GDN1 TaxID=2944810 RepID=UPI00247870AD|nr:response regulator [Thauera sp. GDN1]WEN42857.1 Aerobic respiration control protein ArcA [Thauera sp. GDN1]
MSPSPDTNTASLLVVDDDLVTQARLKAYFSQEGYRVLLAEDGEAFWRQLEKAAVDLVLLDINLPGQDGLSLARELRARDPAIGIILLTSRNDDIDKIVGLEVGADDYVTKPFNPRELLARVKSLLRRTGGRHDEDEEIFRFAGWTLNLPRRRLCDPQGADIALTRGEFEALALLVRHAGEVINRDRLSRAISGHDWSPQDRTVDVLVRRLRTKLDGADKPDSLISTVRGEGYRLAVDAERARG